MKEKLEFKEFAALMAADRSIRRFDAQKEINKTDLEALVGLTRFCASGRNAQPLKYFVASDKELNEKIFSLLKWAGYYKDWDGPNESERPNGYIIQCLDTEIAANSMADDGLHLQTITLGATAQGLGCCIIKSFNAPALSKLLKLSMHLTPLHVVAVGYPAETVKIVDIKNGDFKYYRNEKDEQCVPKRPLSELLID